MIFTVPESEIAIDLTLPDARFDAPELFLPRRKPVGNVVIDRTNFYGKRLKHAYIFTDDLLGKDLAGNRDGVIVGNTITQSGNNLLSTGDNNNHRLNLESVSESDFMSGRSDLTALSKVFYQDLGGRTAPRIFDKSNSGGGVGGYQFGAWENNNQWAFDIDNVYNLSVPHTFGADRIYEVGITIETDTEAHLNVRGIGTDTAAISGTYPVTTTTNAAIANWNHTTDRNWTGEIFYVYFFEGLLTDAQMEEVWNNPYQFLIPANE